MLPVNSSCYHYPENLQCNDFCKGMASFFSRQYAAGDDEQPFGVRRQSEAATALWLNLELR